MATFLHKCIGDDCLVEGDPRLLTLQAGQNNRNQESFNGGELEVLLAIFDEHKYFGKKIRGKMSWNHETFRGRFINSKFSRPAVFAKFLTVAGYLDSKPRSLSALRTFFVKGSRKAISAWRLGLVHIPSMYDLSDGAVSNIYADIMNGNLTSVPTIKQLVDALLARVKLNVCFFSFPFFYFCFFFKQFLVFDSFFFRAKLNPP